MIHWCKNKALLIGCLATFFLAAFVCLRLESRPVFLPLTSERCKVISVERLEGNAGVTRGQRIKEWGRRQLDKLGFHLIGPRGDRFRHPLDPRDNTHVVGVLCEGQFTNSKQLLKELGEEMSRLLAECIDDENSVPLRPSGCLPGRPGQVWFIWRYDDAEVFKPFPSANPTLAATSFLPNYLILMPKVGGKELVKLPMAN
ncbi:MAG: hypothetical protein JWM16_1116 [Verrucomicrobiales bacterium]|nr:hypothetical protein [Verrucomicrobiales bacterium]